jgi:S-adenosylmethionine decarboxylase
VIIHTYTLEIKKVSFEKANSVAVQEVLLNTIADHLQYTILHSRFHQFQPQGVTGLLLLAESHLAVHTWPELGYVHITLASCKDCDALVQAELRPLVGQILETDTMKLTTVVSNVEHPLHTLAE